MAMKLALACDSRLYRPVVSGGARITGSCQIRTAVAHDGVVYVKSRIFHRGAPRWGALVPFSPGDQVLLGRNRPVLGELVAIVS